MGLDSSEMIRASRVFSFHTRALTSNKEKKAADWMGIHLGKSSGAPKDGSSTSRSFQTYIARFYFSSKFNIGNNNTCGLFATGIILKRTGLPQDSPIQIVPDIAGCSR
jgi:hypothetical protein